MFMFYWPKEKFAEAEMPDSVSNMSKAEILRIIITEKLTTAAQEILAVVERTVAGYEEEAAGFREEIDRQRRQLEVLLQPRVKLERIVTADQYGVNVKKEEEEEEAGGEELQQEEDYKQQQSEEDTERLSLLGSDEKEEDEEEQKEEGPALSSHVQQEEANREDDLIPLSLNASIESSDALLSCKVCNVLWGSMNVIIKHAWNHVDDPQSVCGVCGEHSESAEELRSHLQSHQKPHQKVHVEDKPFKCDFCQKSFSYKGALKVHSRLCSRTLTTRRSLSTHMLIRSEEKHHGCEVCGKRFTRLNNLRSHENVHKVQDKPYLCEVCCKAFHSIVQLNRHLKTHCAHQEKAHVCGECGKGFTFKFNLMVHMKSHSEERPFSCSECRKSFKLKSHLKTHLRLHTGLKPLVCCICGRREHLVGHMRTHNSEKPYQCTVCDKASTQSKGGVPADPETTDSGPQFWDRNSRTLVFPDSAPFSLGNQYMHDMDEDRSAHITIQQGGTLPQLDRCKTCCQKFHCPFCSPTLFHPTKLSKCRTHLDHHFNRAVCHEGYTIHRCGLGCRLHLHYHCLYCGVTLVRKPDLLKHLDLCKKKHSANLPSLATTPLPPAVAPTTSTTTKPLIL